MKTYKLTYFKASGKYYSDHTRVYEIGPTCEDAFVKELHECKKLPGLGSGGWGGYVLIQALPDGVPRLVDLTAL